MEHLLHKSSYKGQAYKSCAGILSLSRKYGQERLERASERALGFGAVSYRHIQSILEKELDRLPTREEVNQREEKTIQHENIRGATAYA